MTRQNQFLTISFIGLSFYTLLYLNLLPFLSNLISREIIDQILPTLPFNLIVTLGSYCLWELGMGVLTFGECEGAYQELMNEITMARDDLRVKGVSVD